MEFINIHLALVLSVLKFHALMLLVELRELVYKKSCFNDWSLFLAEGA